MDVLVGRGDVELMVVEGLLPGEFRFQFVPNFERNRWIEIGFLPASGSNLVDYLCELPPM